MPPYGRKFSLFETRLAAVILLLAAGIGGCSTALPIAPDLPQNVAPVPEEAPNPNLPPNYGGKLKSDEELEQSMKELESERETHTKETVDAIKRRK